MQNKWTASVAKTEDNTKETTPKKNNSKKIGLAMGIVGAVLVTAGAAPMLFGNSDNLTGDVTDQQEAVDPLVALLSGGNETASTETAPVATPAVTPATTVAPVATVAPTPKAVKNNDKSTANTNDKIVKVTNTNTGTTDKTGENFHDAAALVNTSNKNTTIKSGSNSVSVSGNSVNVTTENTSASVQKTTIKPPRNIQTGFDSNMMLGLLFLLTSGAMFIRSRKTA